MTTQYTGKNWEAADAFLGSKAERPIANNTRMRRLADSGGQARPGFSENPIAVRLHNTDVIVYRPDGTAELYAGGWQTVTTKDRINGYSPVRIWQTKGIWYFAARTAGVWESVARFYDGAIVDAEGMPLNAPSAAKVDALEAEEKRLLARIRRYATAYGQALDAGTIPIPSLGDCLYCHMGINSSLEREPLGDIQRNTDHLTSHLDETYLVPSLAVNALRAQGRPDMGIGLYLGMRQDDPMLHGDGDYFTRTVRQAVTKYLRARLVPTVAR